MTELSWRADNVQEHSTYTLLPFEKGGFGVFFPPFNRLAGQWRPPACGVPLSASSEQRGSATGWGGAGTGQVTAADKGAGSAPPPRGAGRPTGGSCPDPGSASRPGEGRPRAGWGGLREAASLGGARHFPALAHRGETLPPARPGPRWRSAVCAAAAAGGGGGGGGDAGRGSALSGGGAGRGRRSSLPVRRGQRSPGDHGEEGEGREALREGASAGTAAPEAPGAVWVVVLPGAVVKHVNKGGRGGRRPGVLYPRLVHHFILGGGGGGGVGPGRAVLPAESRLAGVEERRAQPGERDPRRGSRLAAAALLPQQAKLSTLKHTHRHTHARPGLPPPPHTRPTHTHWRLLRISCAGASGGAAPAAGGGCAEGGGRRRPRGGGGREAGGGRAAGGGREAAAAALPIARAAAAQPEPAETRAGRSAAGAPHARGSLRWVLGLGGGGAGRAAAGGGADGRSPGGCLLSGGCAVGRAGGSAGVSDPCVRVRVWVCVCVYACVCIVVRRTGRTGVCGSPGSRLCFLCEDWSRIMVRVKGEGSCLPLGLIMLGFWLHSGVPAAAAASPSPAAPLPCFPLETRARK